MPPACAVLKKLSTSNANVRSHRACLRFFQQALGVIKLKLSNDYDLSRSEPIHTRDLRRWEMDRPNLKTVQRARGGGGGGTEDGCYGTIPLTTWPEDMFIP